MHLADNLLLRPCQLERKIIVVETIEILPHPAEHMPTDNALAHTGISKDGKLHIEEFLKLQPIVGLREFVGGGGIMRRTQSLVQRHHAQAFQQVARQGLRYRPHLYLAQKGACKLLQCARGESCLLHTLRCLIVRLHAHLAQHQRVGRVYIGMREVYPVVEERRTAEDDIVGVQLHRLQYILLGVEPNAVHPAVPVSKMPYKALPSALAHLLETDELSADLHKGHVGSKFRRAVKPAPIYVLVGEIVQQVAPGLQTQFLLQGFGTLRTDTRQIRQLCFKKRSAHKKDESCSNTVSPKDLHA